MAGGFGLQYGGRRTLLPEDSEGKINNQRVRDAIQDFGRDAWLDDLEGGIGRVQRPWNDSGIGSLQKSQAWGRMLDYKQSAVAKKNKLIDRANAGDREAIKELNDMAANEKNLMMLKAQYKLPQRPQAIEGVRSTERNRSRR